MHVGDHPKEDLISHCCLVHHLKRAVGELIRGFVCGNWIKGSRAHKAGAADPKRDIEHGGCKDPSAKGH